MRALSSPPAFSLKDERQTRKLIFARRVRDAMEMKGWRPTDLLRETAALLGSGHKLSSSHISHYINGRSFPNSEVRAAISQALQVDLERPPEPEEQGAVYPASALKGRGIVVEDAGDGTAHLLLESRLPWPVVVRILDLVHGQQEGQ